MSNFVIHKSESRGSANHGWLKAKHSFSFERKKKMKYFQWVFEWTGRMMVTLLLIITGITPRYKLSQNL